MNNEPIVLSGINAAVFTAKASFHDNTKWRFPQKSGLVEITEAEAETWNKGLVIKDCAGKCSRWLAGITYYETKEGWYKDMRPYQLAYMRYVYGYLKEHYPDTDYAERFSVSESWGCNSYWAKELGISCEEIKGERCL